MSSSVAGAGTIQSSGAPPVCNHACPYHCAAFHGASSYLRSPYASSSPSFFHSADGNGRFLGGVVDAKDPRLVQMGLAHVAGASGHPRASRPKRRSHGIMTIGDILARLDLFDAAKQRGLSKNRACAAIEISKGTVGTYQLRVHEATRYGIPLAEFREYKWRDFRQVFRTTVWQSGLVIEGDDEETNDETTTTNAANATSTTATHTGARPKSSTAPSTSSQKVPPMPPIDKKLADRSDALLEDTIRLSIPDIEVGPFILAKLKVALEPLRVATGIGVNTSTYEYGRTGTGEDGATPLKKRRRSGARESDTSSGSGADDEDDEDEVDAVGSPDTNIESERSRGDDVKMEVEPAQPPSPRSEPEEADPPSEAADLNTVTTHATTTPNSHAPRGDAGPGNRPAHGIVGEEEPVVVDEATVRCTSTGPTGLARTGPRERRTSADSHSTTSTTTSVGVDRSRPIASSTTQNSSGRVLTSSLESSKKRRKDSSSSAASGVAAAVTTTVTTTFTTHPTPPAQPTAHTPIMTPAAAPLTPNVTPASSAGAPTGFTRLSPISPMFASAPGVFGQPPPQQTGMFATPPPPMQPQPPPPPGYMYFAHHPQQQTPFTHPLQLQHQQHHHHQMQQAAAYHMYQQQQQQPQQQPPAHMPYSPFTLLTGGGSMRPPVLPLLPPQPSPALHGPATDAPQRIRRTAAAAGYAHGASTCE